MPKTARALSDLEVRRLKVAPGQNKRVVVVGGATGLLLTLTAAGGRTWCLRATVGDCRRDIGLGGYPAVTLAMAREAARTTLAAIRAGVDPVEERKAARAALKAAQARGLTFSDAVTKYLAVKTAELSNDKHVKQWRSTLDAHAIPAIGAMLVDDVTVADVLRVLQPIWETKTETASRLRGRIESVLNWATAHGHRTGENPARWKGNLDSMLAKPSKVSQSGNQPAVALDDAAAWFSALRKREGVSARALEFAVLCASRSGEVRGALWSEVDLDAGVWVIPAARMKAAREHRVALPAAAVALLKSTAGEATRKRGGLIFPAARGGPLSDMSLSAVMRRMQESAVEAGDKGWLDPRSGRPAVPHGLRSTFRDWAAERTDFPREIAEIALAHHVGSEVERAYRRSDMLERRRDLMEAWTAFLGAGK